MAVLIAAVANLAGAFVTTAVAKTVGKGIIDTGLATEQTVLAAEVETALRGTLGFGAEQTAGSAGPVEMDDVAGRERAQRIAGDGGGPGDEHGAGGGVDVPVGEAAEIGHHGDAPGQAAVRDVDGDAFGPHHHRGLLARGAAVAAQGGVARAQRAGRLDAAVEDVAAAEEAGDEEVGGALVDLLGRPDLAHPAVVHHHEPVGHGQRLLLVVGNEQGGQAEALLQGADFDSDLGAQAGIEVGEWLVEQEYAGVDHEGAGQCHALLLAARHLGDAAVGIAVEPHQPQRLGDTGVALGLRHPAHFQAEADIFGHRHVREQRVALEHHAGIAGIGRRPRDIGAADQDAPGGRRDEPGDHPQRRGFAAAGRAEQGDQLALGDFKVHPVNRDGRAVGLAQAFEHEAGHDTTLERFT